MLDRLFGGRMAGENLEPVKREFNRLQAQGDCDQVKGNAQKKVGEIKKVFGQ